MDNNIAKDLVDDIHQKDNFGKWLGIQVIDVREGYSKVQMEVREDMLNGLGIAHGGIAFSLADSAFGYACNNRNQYSVALDTSITFTRSSNPWDMLTAEAQEVHNGKSTGVYIVTITNQKGEQVALFKGTCFRTDKNHK